MLEESLLIDYNHDKIVRYRLYVNDYLHLACCSSQPLLCFKIAGLKLIFSCSDCGEKNE